MVTESSATADAAKNPRAARLLLAEQGTLAAGGCCLRLAGLYTLERGPHNYWLASGNPVNGNPDDIINLLHCEDAASACLAALRAGESVRQRVFLISDGNPLSRRQICQAALQNAVYSRYTMPEFVEGTGFSRKVYDGSASEQALNWSPRYESFTSYLLA